MMKRTSILCAAAIAAFQAFGIGATQEWVRRYVVDALTGVVRSSKATNIEVEANIPASEFAGADTNDTISCTIRAGVGSHPALKVVASSVPEIPAGTFYARDDSGNYVNCSNALIGTIYSVPYTVSQVSTNAFGVVSTNSVRMGNFWATDSTNGVWRMGIDGDTILYNSGQRSAYFAIRSTTLPERAAAALIPPRSAMLSVRDMLSLIMPTVHAATREEIVYTVNSEKTVAITTITFTRTNRLGKTTTITFTPEGLEGVYSGPSGPFNSKAEAEEAVTNLDNWDFRYNGDSSWLRLIDPNERIEISRADFENSDVWKQLVGAVGTELVEVEIPTPKMPAHPCPAPVDIWTLDRQANEWIPNAAYITVIGNEWDWNVDKLDEWRGRNDCKCAVVGCPNCGVSKHRPGRVKVVGDDEIYSDDADGSDGCKCCIRCAKHGSDFMKTINEYNDHRASGEGAGFCGCACGKYDAENESEWPQDFHNLPAHTLAWPSLDFSCMCYCAKDKALNGEYVRHAKYAGDSPWCDNICARCGMVEDQEQYISHSYPAFDTRHVTLREAEWKDHKPRSEAEAGVSLLNDPTYYDRCGCACGVYDTKNGGLLPAEFGDFHQYHNVRTCLCTCGQVHRKNSMGDGEDPAEPWPCPEICAICNKVEDKGANQTITIDGTAYKKLVLVDPDDEMYHEADGTECGCKCYNGEYGGSSSRHAWSVGAAGLDSIELDGFLPKFHKVSDDGCTCRCNILNAEATGSHKLMWNIAHSEWFAECDCPGICGVCHRKAMLGEEAKPADHEPSPNACGCLCGYFTAANQREIKLHSLVRDAAVPCFCACRSMHPGYSQRHQCAVCANCGMSSDGKQPDDESLHVLKEGATDEGGNRICRCDCGYYSSELAIAPDVSNTTFVAVATVPSPAGKLHDFDGNEVRGVSNCICICGAKHDFREPPTVWKNAHPYEWCPGVCQSCRQRTKDGKAATEEDHTRKHVSEHKCGCRCGWFGVDQEHTDGGREATKQKLHVQSYSDGTAGNPSWCQCWGLGTGGAWHWHHPFASTSCKDVCQDLRPGDTSLGHLAAGEPSPNARGFAEATPDHHVGNAYGCGCKCGRCNASNRALWKDGNISLHHPVQNATDQCHCSCESRKLVGSDEGGHTFASDSACVCTCGERFRTTWLNACGYCAQCHMVHRYRRTIDDVRVVDAAGVHDWTDKANHNCKCRCEMYGPDHTSGERVRDGISGEPATIYCELCDRNVQKHTERTYCSDCGDLLGTAYPETGHGEHPTVEEDDAQPWIECGEELKNGTTCGTHYAGGTCPNQSNHKNGTGGGSTQGGQTGGTGGAQTI